jgi:hypothetical protein
MPRLERTVEERFGELLSKWAYANKQDVLYLKLQIPGNRGWPDRVVMFPHNHTLFIEWKREGEDPRKLQLHIHGVLRKMGFEVQVHDNEHIAMAEVTAFILASSRTDPRHEANRSRKGGEVVPASRKGEDGDGAKGV